MNASYVDDLEGVGKVIVTQVPTLDLENWIFDLEVAGSEAEHSVGLLEDGARAQGAAHSHAHKQPRTG